MYAHAMFTLLLQLFLTSLAAAAPITVQKETAWQYGLGGGIIGFIVLVLDVIVWIEVLKSTRSVPAKLLWCVLVFIFPLVGIIIYWLFSNREAHKTGYEPIV